MVNRERDISLKFTMNLLIYFKHNRIVYYNNSAYKLDFLSLH